jgi:hypothetical protein
MILRRANLLITASLLLAMSDSGAQALQLISPDEAKLPDAPPLATRAITRGPGVKLVSPESGKKESFPFRIAFEPRGNSKIDPASVQVIYLKHPQVDLTDRIKSSISPGGIDLASASAPPGDHPIRVLVRDDEGRQGTATIKLSIR